MATLREVFNRDVMLSYAVNQPLTKTPMQQTGAFVTDASVSALLRSGVKEFGVPFINGIDTNLESNYGNTIYTDIAQPREITGGSTKGRMAYLNDAFLESRLERFLLGESPLAMMQGMIDNYWAQQAEHRAVATLYGIRNLVMNNAGLKADFVVDNSKATAPTADNAFSVDQFIDVEATLEGQYRGAGAIIVHPKIAAKMRKQALVEQVTTSDNLPPISVYNGRAVIEVNSPMTVIGTGATAQYVSYLVGAGAFVADSAQGVDDLVVDRTEGTGNGAGHTALWTRRNMIIHPQGFNFIATDAELTGGTKNEALSASWTDLTKKEYWTLGTDAARTSIRFLITNL